MQGALCGYPDFFAGRPENGQAEKAPGGPGIRRVPLCTERPPRGAGGGPACRSPQLGRICATGIGARVSRSKKVRFRALCGDENISLRTFVPFQNSRIFL